MDKKSLTKFTGIVAAFIVLTIGYVYFNEQSLLTSGRNNTDLVVESIENKDSDAVKKRLDEFVGGIDPSTNEEYNQALVSIDFVSSLIKNGESLSFVGGALSDSGEYRLYAAAYEIAVPQGGEDYLVVTMRRQEGSWVLSNIQLLATNPFTD